MSMIRKVTLAPLCDRAAKTLELEEKANPAEGRIVSL